MKGFQGLARAPLRSAPNAEATQQFAGVTAGGEPASAVEVIDLDWPGPSAWTSRQYARFAALLHGLCERTALAGIVLTGPRLFLAADHPARASSAALDDVLAQVAQSAVPIIAAIPGPAADEGLELALACAARVGVADARLVHAAIHAARLPHLTTLRLLPQTMGAEAATSLIGLGRPISATQARREGLLDALAGGAGLLETAKALARATRTSRARLETGGDPLGSQAQFFLARRMLRREAPLQIAPLAVVRAMEASVQMTPRRAAAERDRLAAELALSDQGRALRHADAAVRSARERLVRLGVDETALAARLQWPMVREAIHLLDEGATPAKVDRALTDYGFSRGPFARADAVGFAAIFSTGGAELACGEDWSCYSPTLDLMADAGRLGGSSPGWFKACDDEASSRFDPQVEHLIHRSAVSQRLHRQPLSDPRVLARCLNAAVNAAYGMLETHDELTIADLDGVWIRRLGFPAWRGGLGYDAALRGLPAVVDALGTQAEDRNTAGRPCAGLLAAERDLGRSAPLRQDRAAR